MNFFLFSLLISTSFAIECLYLDVEVGYYGCEVLKDLSNQTSEFITGNHSRDKTDSDVKSLFINAKHDVEFSPLYCRTFENLLHIQIERLDQARREDFKDCRKVEHLIIVGTELWWLPEDTFSAMSELKKLEIAANKIVYLPRDLIVNNRKLESLQLQDNKIEVVDIEFPASLKEIDMRANQCIDRNVPSLQAKNVEEFNKIVSEKCGSSTARKVKELERVIAEMRKNKNLTFGLDNDMVQVAGAAIGFAASIPHTSARMEADNYKSWFIFLACLCMIMTIGWAGTAFVLMKRLNDLTHGDHHYLVSMDANARREFLEE